jgi:hypothetical protein
VSGFAVSPEDVVQVKQGENTTVSTSADLKTHTVKITNTQGQLVDLLPLSSNTWSLQGLTPGVYKLDVIADMSSSGIMGAFETVLVILGLEQQPLPPAQYITMIQSVSVRSDIGRKNPIYATLIQVIKHVTQIKMVNVVLGLD